MALGVDLEQVQGSQMLKRRVLIECNKVDHFARDHAAIGPFLIEAHGNRE